MGTHLHHQLARRRKRARNDRLLRIGKRFEHLTDEALDRVDRDHQIMVRRRQKQYASSLRGPERARRLHDILKAAMLQLPMKGGRGEAFWRADRLLHKKACRHLASNLLPEARRLFKRDKVRWWTIRKYTPDMAFYSRTDRDREIASATGLIKLVS